jgi:outer membrane murein-binding lipoprotein Lpp
LGAAAVFSAMLFLASCVNETQKMGLAKVDSLMLQVDSAEAKLAMVNVDTLKFKYDQYKKFNGLLIENFEAIKTEENFQRICLYRYVKKTFELMIKEYPDFEKNIDTAKVQLKNLREDISSDLLTEQEMRSYCELERINVRDLKEKITFRVDNAIKEEANFDTIHPMIVRYVNEALAKKEKRK